MHYNYRYYQTVLTLTTHLPRTLPLPSPCVRLQLGETLSTIGDQRSERPVWWRHRRGTAGQDTGKQLLPGTAPANTHLTHTYTHIDTCNTHTLARVTHTDTWTRDMWPRYVMSHGAAAASLAPAPGPRHPAHTVGDTGEEGYKIFFSLILISIWQISTWKLDCESSTITAKLFTLAVNGIKD